MLPGRPPAVRDVLTALAVAPLIGAAVLAGPIVWWQYPHAPFSDVFAAATYITPFCYLAECVCFVPTLLMLRQLRNPHLVIATVAGASAASLAVIPVALLIGGPLNVRASVVVGSIAVPLFALAGAVAGFTYGWVMRYRRVHAGVRALTLREPFKSRFSGDAIACPKSFACGVRDEYLPTQSKQPPPESQPTQARSLN